MLCNISNNLENYRVLDDIDFVLIKKLLVCFGVQWCVKFSVLQSVFIVNIWQLGVLIDWCGVLNLLLCWGKKWGCGLGWGCVFMCMCECKKRNKYIQGFVCEFEVYYGVNMIECCVFVRVNDDIYRK